jgi:flagellar biosynthesis/type III secretory pathway protein FliH
MLAKSIAQTELPFERQEIYIPAEWRSQLAYEASNLYKNAYAAFEAFAPPKDKEYTEEKPFEVHFMSGGFYLKILSSRLYRISHLLAQLNKDPEHVFTAETAQKNQEICSLARDTARNIEQAISQLIHLYANQRKGGFLNGFEENDMIYFNLLQHLHIVQNTKKVFHWLKELLNIPKS